MSASKYRKQGVGNNIFSWMPANPMKDASFVVEEKDDRVLLVGVLPASTKDKHAIKALKNLYPGKTVEFHPDFQKVKKTAFL